MNIIIRYVVMSMYLTKSDLRDAIQVISERTELQRAVQACLCKVEFLTMGSCNTHAKRAREP